jgi:hypothetical protein
MDAIVPIAVIFCLVVAIYWMIRRFEPAPPWEKLVRLAFALLGVVTIIAILLALMVSR